MKMRMGLAVLLACAMASPALAQTNTTAVKPAAATPVAPAKAVPAAAQPTTDKAAPPAAAGQPDPQAEMEAWLATAAPGEHHEHLAKMAGEWDCTIKSGWGGKMEESKGTSKNHMRMGGRYLVSNFSGKMMNQPMAGQGIMGYNNNSKKYESIWRDNMSTGMMIETGTCDGEGKVITTTGQTIGPDGKAINGRTVYTISDGKYIVEAFMTGPDGKDTKVFEMTCIRTKAPGKAAAGDADDEMDELTTQVKKRVNDAVKPK
jgi:hypothetical protein